MEECYVQGDEVKDDASDDTGIPQMSSSMARRTRRTRAGNLRRRRNRMMTSTSGSPPESSKSVVVIAGKGSEIESEDFATAIEGDNDNDDNEVEARDSIDEEADGGSEASFVSAFGNLAVSDTGSASNSTSHLPSPQLFSFGTSSTWQASQSTIFSIPEDRTNSIFTSRATQGVQCELIDHFGNKSCRLRHPKVGWKQLSKVLARQVRKLSRENKKLRESLEESLEMNNLLYASDNRYM